MLSLFALQFHDIIKIELVNATGNCLLNIFSVRNFFYKLDHSHLSHSNLVKIKGFKYNIDKHFVILNNKWELKVDYQQNFPVGKKLGIIFFDQSVSIKFHC